MTVLELLEKYPNLINATIEVLEFVGDKVEDEQYTNETIDIFTPIKWEEIDEYLKNYFSNVVSFEFLFKNKAVNLFSENGFTVITDYYNGKENAPAIFESNNNIDLWNDLVYYANGGKDDFIGVEEQSYTQYHLKKVREFLTNGRLDDEEVN